MNISIASKVEWFAQPGVGEVVKLITPNERGRVKFRASFWPARLHPDADPNSLSPKQSVVVVGRDGITLLVTPLVSAQTA